MRRAYMGTAGAMALAASLWAGAEEVVVTATRIEVSEARIPASVTVLDRDEIAASGARNVDDALRSVSGVNVLRSYGIGHGIPSQVNIRGVPGIQRTLFLVDGFSANEAYTGFLGLNEIPVPLIRTVELVRGPFSALYGADAFAGVIQALTLDPPSGAVSEGSVSAGNGGYGEVFARAGAGSAAGGFWIAADGRRMDNYLGRDWVNETLTDPATGQSSVRRIDAENYDYEDLRILGKGRWTLGESSELVVQARTFGSDLGYGQVSAIPYYPVPVENRVGTRGVFAGATLASVFTEDVVLKTLGSYRFQERETEGLNFSHVEGVAPVYAPGVSEADSEEWTAGGALEWRIGERHRVMPGVEVRASEADFAALRHRDSGAPFPGAAGRDERAVNTGVFVQDEAALGAKVDVVTGVRLDVNSDFGEAVSPRAGVVYRPTEETTWRASVGRAYRAPSLLELYQPPVSFGSIAFVSNPDLEPETIVAGDLGVEQKAGAVTLRGGGFYNDMRDLIANRLAGPTMTFVNVNEAWSAGVEAGLEWRVVPGVQLFGNTTYQQTEDRATGQDLSYMPEHAANAGVRCAREGARRRIEASATGHWVGERGYPDTSTGQWMTLDDYFRTDIRVRGTLENRYWVEVSAQNALDATYRESSVLDPAPGRLWSVQAGARF